LKGNRGAPAARLTRVEVQGREAAGRSQEKGRGPFLNSLVVKKQTDEVNMG